jgi:hypothetical protein
MGNVIAAPDRTVEASKIADFINKWALESYDDGLNYGKSRPLISNKQLLKKRACCTSQDSMPIALPTLVEDVNDKNKFVGIVSADTTTSLVLDNNGKSLGVPSMGLRSPHTNVLVRIFNDTNNLENKCIFDTDNKTTTNYAVNVSPQGGWTFSTNACANLYHGTNDRTDDSFCKHVRDDRSKVYKLDSQVAYGPTNFNVDNSYLDCNCENSLLRKAQDKIAIYDKNNQQPIHTVDADLMVQLLDQKCEEVDSFSKIYKKNIQNLCINLSDLRNINIQDKGILNTNQTCGTTGIPSGTGGGSTPVAPPVSFPTLPPPVRPTRSVVPVPVPTTTGMYTVPPFKSYDKKILNITIIVASVVGSVAMLIYMIVTIVLAVKKA